MVDIDDVMLYIAHQLPQYICHYPDRKTKTIIQIKNGKIYHGELVVKVLEGYEKQKRG